MPKANRTCYCCGRKYYYCPSCPDDRRNPRIYVMWDSELCREIFNVLTDESIKKITTLECKNKLIKLGVTKDTVLKESVRNHVDRVMSYKEEVVEEVIQNIVEELHVGNFTEDAVKLNNEIQIEEKETESVIEFVSEKSVLESITETEGVIEPIKKIRRTRKSSLKNKENSEVD